MIKLEFIKNKISRYEEFNTVNEAIDRISEMAVKDDIFTPDAKDKLNSMSGDKDMSRQLAELMSNSIAPKIKQSKKLTTEDFNKLKNK